MNIKLEQISVILITVILFSTFQVSLAQSKSEIYKDRKGVAIKGYDPVAYHSVGEAVKGEKEYELEWQGIKWHFASLENRALFELNPEKYTPRYGGYCAWAVSQGYTASVDPKNAWRIVDGKLYLNYNNNVQKKWEEDIPGNIEKGNTNWPGVLEQ